MTLLTGVKKSENQVSANSTFFNQELITTVLGVSKARHNTLTLPGDSPAKPTSITARILDTIIYLFSGKKSFLVITVG